MKNKIILIIFISFTLFLPISIFANQKKVIKKQIKKEEKYSREKLRAFYTAPPVIPHEVTAQRGRKECMYCHKEVLHVGGRTSVKTPHKEFFNCQQCHVQGNLKGKGFTATTWKGLEEPKKGTRANEVAPPTIPHRLFLRKNCTSCHGANNPDKKLRSPHTERTNCLQCHVPIKKRQF